VALLWAQAPLARHLDALVPSVGAPLASVLLRAIAVLAIAASLFQLRTVLASVVATLLAWLDALEARLETLPKAPARGLRVVGLGLLVGLVVSAIGEGTRVGASLEARTLDAFFRLRFPERSQVELATGSGTTSAHRQEEVVVLAIDDATVANLGWPIPRDTYARAIDALREARPASVTFDLALVDPSRDHPEWDERIGAAAKQAGNTSFGFTVSKLGQQRAATSPAGLAAIEANSIPWHDSADALPEYAEIVGGDVELNPVIDPILGGARSIAMVNVLLDGDDDLLRHSLVVARIGKRLLPSLSLRLAVDALGLTLSDVRIVPGSHLDLGGKRTVPIDRLGRTLVRYQGRHDAREGPIRYVSLWTLIGTPSTVTLTGNPMGDDQRFVLDGQTVVTLDGKPSSLGAVEALLALPGAAVAGRARYSPEPGRILELEVRREAGEPNFEIVDEHTLRFATTLASYQATRGARSEFSGKHVFVGSTALAAADLRNSPLGEIPGVEHHATMLANLLAGDLFRSSPVWLNVVLIFFVALIAVAIGVSTSAGVAVLLDALLSLVTLTGGYLLFVAGHQVPVVAPVAAIGLSAIVTTVLGARLARNARAKAEAERTFVRQTFGRYLTEQVVQELLDAPDGLRLGGQRAFVTIMMTDLRGFTSMCGTMQPEDVVRLLNHYLETMTRIINTHGGTIDEFIGDAILVVFGAPLRLERAEARAVACAIEMLNAMPEVNRWNLANGLPKVEMGIGVHSGEVVLGNIGSELRAKYGIVGATINLTSRVESYTVGGQVLISEATRERCGALLTIGASQTVSPKGVKGTLTIHEALAVGAPFEVKLDSAHEALRPPRVPLELRFAKVKGKEVGEVTHVAHVEAISELGLELRVDEAPPLLTDLQLRVFEHGSLRAGDLYGKVLRVNVRPNVVYLRLTSVPPELQAVLDSLRGPEVARPAPVPDSALVSA